MDSIKEYPLLHIYPSIAPRQPARIAGNTPGLMALTTTLIEASSTTANSSTELYCADGEAFEVQVIRDDTDNAWSAWELPYQEVADKDRNTVSAPNHTRKLERIVQEFRDTLEEIAQGLDEAIIEIAGEDCCWENWSEGRRGMKPAFTILTDSIVELAKIRESANSVLHWEDDSSELEQIEAGGDC